MLTLCNSNSDKIIYFVHRKFYGRDQRRYDMNGISQMQGGTNWILPKGMKANRFFQNSLTGNLEKPLMSLNGTQRERGYGL
jgi:hypothetical protein